MYGITNKPVTLVTQQVTSEGDVERATTEKKDISSTSSSDGNAAQKIVQEKLVTRAEKLAMTSESWKPTLRSPESVTLRSSLQAESQSGETNSAMSGGNTQSSTYSLAEVLATLAVKLGDSTVVGQMFRATATQLMGSAASAALIQKSQGVENAQQELTQANSAYSEAIKAENEANDNLLQVETSLNNAKLSLDDAQDALTSAQIAYNDALNAIYSTDEEKTLAINTAADRVTSAQQAVDVAADEYQQAIDARSKAQTAATDATKNAQQKQQAVITATQMLKVAQDALESATVSPQVVNNDNTGSINRVDLMMAQLVTILGKCNEETLKTNMELAKSQQSAKQAELAKETEKSDKIAEKQKRMHKIFGALGKVLMAVTMIAGAISALFTGGVMAILFVASTALMISDQITKAATGESFMGKAMNAVVSELAKMFEAMGADELVASILASITMLLATIAATVVLGKGAKFLNNKFASKIANSILRVLSNHGTSGAGRIMKMGSEITFRVSLTASGINNGAYSITSGVYEQQRANISAKLIEIMKDNDFVKRFMDMIVENYSNTMKTMNAIIKNETEASGMSMQVGKQILAHTRA
ncbi:MULTISPECIES: type III secretion system translocon subunit SctE [Citrobacter]|uniref:type III secretion system translocon subunit SctE n=1 Tax=Citrobacter TaxID=544 RepID=UPI00166088E7|nr:MULTISPECIES: type III secretion system translocon subunit SctE [Citrobacter]MBA4712523.1 type III secretion system translocon subunit SctE [Citrobacter pasteurii]MBD0800725.1 type III secretion system translocon subunit SctE [Citrobacter sp. C6_1]MBD0809209.1 type III secretion system translocon subunit SctE [Citrobacter sp. C6_2]